MSKDDEYMHEINRLEGERDYWRATHAKTDAECVRLRAKLDEVVAELQARKAWRLTKTLDERTSERDEARDAARWHRKALLSDADIRLHRYELGAKEWPWIESVDAADSVSVP